MWRPILSDAAYRDAWTTIEEIERSVSEHLASNELLSLDPTLASGTAGIALFYAYLDAARPGTDAGDRALDCLGESMDRLGSTRALPSLYAGFTGTGWAIEHLRHGFFDGDDDLTDPIDGALEELLEHPEQEPYELILGVAGYGMYLLERLPHPAATDLVVRAIDRLAETAERSEAGCTWFSRPDWQSKGQKRMTPGGCYNLGVAHGVPGILGFLASAHRMGVTDPRIEELAEGTVRWLLSQRLPGEESSAFPSSSAPITGPVPARTAWCYGDLGITAVLLLAARSFRRPDWEDEAVALARAAAGRSIEDTGVVDACLCHGFAGNGHLFVRLYQATGDPVLRKAALTWLDHALAFRRPAEEVAGFPSWRPDDDGDGKWVADPGFLMGASGVGLALLAAASDVEPEWDRVMLLSIPSQPGAAPGTEGVA